MRISDWSSDVCSSDLPVVLADAQDNAGGGANSDTTGLLRALIAEGAEGAVLANLYDPEAAAAAHAAGEGAEIELALGGRSGVPGDAPLQATFKVLRLRSEEHTSELQSLLRISYA